MAGAHSHISGRLYSKLSIIIIISSSSSSSSNSSSSSSSSRNEYDLGGTIAVLLQDHRTVSTKSACNAPVHGDRSALNDGRAAKAQCIVI